MLVRFVSRAAMALLAFAMTLALGRPAAAAGSATGFVYVATNANNNSVIQYARASDGSLIKMDEAPTGGSGTGVIGVDPLASQDSLVLSADGSILVVVNAASGEISSLRAGSGGLQPLSVISSNGTFPNSLAIRGDVVYVLNAKGMPNITAFRLNAEGMLSAIPGSTRDLPGGSNAGPHDVLFSPDGGRLLVTEGGTGQIDVFQLDADGLATGVTTTASVGPGPFGMRFGRDGALIVVEAGSASASSYALTPQNSLSVISPAVANGQKATCWLSVTPNGKFVFTSDTGSGTYSTYQVSGIGALNLANPVSATAGGGAPIDSAITSDVAFMYVVDSALGRLLAYGIHGASLRPMGAVTGLPKSIQGIAAN